MIRTFLLLLALLLLPLQLMAFTEEVTQITRGPILLSPSAIFDEPVETPVAGKTQYKYRPQADLLKKVADNKLPREASAIRDWVLSFHFQNRQAIILDNLQSQESYPIPSNRYDKNGEYPFDGFLAAREALFALPIDQLSSDTLGTIHTKLLSKESIRADRPGGRQNSENTPNADLGRMRIQNVGYRPYASTDDKIFTPTPVTLTDGRPLVKPATYTELAKINPFIQFKNSNGTRWVNFAKIEEWQKPEYASRLSPELKEKLAKELAQSQGPKVAGELTQAMVKELANALFAELRAKLARAKTKGEIVDAVAEFHYNFVSVHPFINGNGRMTRLLVERILNEYNIPSPIWTSMDEDMELPLDQFKLLLRDSVHLSENFYHALNVLVDANVDVEALALPFLYSQTELDNMVKDAKIKSTIIPEEFMTWVYASKDKKFTDLKSALVAYDAWKLELKNKSDVTGSEEIALAPPSFICGYGKLSCEYPEFNHKFTQFYDPTGMIYRGVGMPGHPTNESIIRSFVLPGGGMVGNSVSPSTDKAHLDEEFRRFNVMLARDPSLVHDTFTEHVEELSDYGKTKMMSTSVDMDQAYGFTRRTYGKSKMANSGILYMAHLRKVATVDAINSPWQSPWGGEQEITYYLGNDPEALEGIMVEDYDKDQKLEGSRIFQRTQWNQIEMKQFDADGKKLLATYTYTIDATTGKVLEKLTTKDGQPIAPAEAQKGCHEYEFGYLDFINKKIDHVQAALDFVIAEPSVDKLNAEQKIIYDQLKAAKYNVDTKEMLRAIGHLSKQFHIDVIKTLIKENYEVDLKQIRGSVLNQSQADAIKFIAAASPKSTTKKVMNFAHLDLVTTNIHASAVEKLAQFNYQIDFEQVAKLDNPFQVEVLRKFMKHGYYSGTPNQFDLAALTVIKGQADVDKIYNWIKKNEDLKFGEKLSKFFARNHQSPKRLALNNTEADIKDMLK